jgi:CheY-like chemotaxis protein
MALILFVDDDVATLELMSKAVEMLGHQALLCSSAKDVLNTALKMHPDMILVDQQLQDSQGCELIELLHKSPGLHTIPVYLVSAYTSAEEKESARQAGAADCFEKPVSMQNLIEMLGGKPGPM